MKGGLEVPTEAVNYTDIIQKLALGYVQSGTISDFKSALEFSETQLMDTFDALSGERVDLAIGTQVEKNYQTARILGVDPKSGHSVQARIGRYGPMVELIAPNGEKGQSASLKKGQLIESITLEEALDLFALPRNLGELDGEPLMVGIGKFGPYVRHGKTFAS
jgi:topoisomerase IA-like protein